MPTDKDGYLIRHVAGKRRTVHRMLMEEYLGRTLGPNEVVHHKDGNKLNNKMNNLGLMTRQQHSKHHAPELAAAMRGKCYPPGNTVTHKRCSVCAEIKPRTDYYLCKDTKKPGGFRENSRCKACDSARNRKRHTKT